jgi:hypothetical protein
MDESLSFTPTVEEEKEEGGNDDDDEKDDAEDDEEEDEEEEDKDSVRLLFPRSGIVAKTVPIGSSSSTRVFKTVFINSCASCCLQFANVGSIFAMTLLI